MGKLEEFQNQIIHPPEEAKGLTRWWWYGAAVTREEITYELDQMQQAGIGGVELQILYPVVPDNEEKGIRNLPYGSPEFYEILAYTASECQKRGMTFDITPGSSWPFGGPVIDIEQAMECVMPYQIDVHGPCTFSMDLTNYVTGTIVAACLGKMEHCVMVEDSVRDIMDAVRVTELFGWPWGYAINPIEIPPGDWKIVLFVVHLHRNLVGKPAPNAGGYVLDHCSGQALDCFLENMVEPILDQVGRKQIRSLFCDSIEVEGHNWTSLLLTEFEKRRGYSLKPYIYGLWGNLGEISEDVRYDYFRTMSELTLENFFDRFTDFCHKNQVLSRIQAHGTWGDILRAYAAADIPEGETFGPCDHLWVNTIHRKLAVSAAHLYGKPVVSNETFTWLTKPRFTETPEDLKLAADVVFADGCNMIVNHGYSYVPPDTGKYGCPFYASSHINHTTPWWPYYSHVGQYIHRVSALLRRGEPVSRILLYLPQADVWSQNLMSDLHLALKLEQQIGAETGNFLHQAGYEFDYVNDEILTEAAQMEGPTLQIQGNSYEAVLLVGCTRLPEQTAEVLCQFAENGGILISAEQIPEKGCGLVNRAAKAELVKNRMQTAFQQPKAKVVSNRAEALTAALSEFLQPDIFIERKEKVGFVHRQEKNDHLYFLPNISKEEAITSILFFGHREKAAVVDLETGNVCTPRKIEYTEDGCKMELCFAPCQSVVVLFSNELDKTVIPYLPKKQTWSTVSPQKCVLRIPQTGQEFAMAKPETWQSIPELQYFSGTGEYILKFSSTEAYRQVFLQLEELSCCCKVWVNHILCGELWKHPYQLDITQAWKPGENIIRLEVVSIPFHELSGPEIDSSQVPASLSQWPYYGKVMENIWSKRANFLPEQHFSGKIPAAGIQNASILLLP